MASDDETVAELVSEVKERASGVNVRCDGLVEDVCQDEVWDACDRIEAAHRREVEKLSGSLALAKKQLEAEVADKSKVVGELNEVRELNRRCCDENERLNSEVAELRECLKEAVFEYCHDCGDDVLENGCVNKLGACFVQRWRKALEGETK